MLYCAVMHSSCFMHVDPWHLQFSKSSKRLYFYNDMTQKSVYEAPPDSVATYQYVLWTVQCYIFVIAWNMIIVSVNTY